MRRILIGCTAALILFASPAALAHDDQAPDDPANACDTWSRPGHGDPSHEHTSTNDTDAGGPEAIWVHNHGGHYVLRGRHGYVEVIGGQGYNRGGDQGGAVQGEIDPGVGGVDGDLHVHLFAGTNNPPEAGICVSVADRKIGDQGSQP